MRFSFTTASICLAAIGHPALAQEGTSTGLSEAVASGLAVDPESQAARFAREAVAANRDEARAAFSPNFIGEASAGARRLENTTRRNLGIAGDVLYPLEAYAEGDLTLFDAGRRSALVRQQEALLEAAGLRIEAQDEAAALEISRLYLEVSLQRRILDAAVENVATHHDMVARMQGGVDRGLIGLPELQLAQQRLETARVREIEAEQALLDARRALELRTGLDIADTSAPPDLAGALPQGGAAREALLRENPALQAADAEAQAAGEAARAARAELYPAVGTDVAARGGEDIDGFRGETSDLRGRVYVRWNLFDGGARRARYEAAQNRAAETRSRAAAVRRDTETDFLQTLNSYQSLLNIEQAYEREVAASSGLLNSYRAQFEIDRRTLFDLLEAQDTLFSTRVRYESTRHARFLSTYRALASLERLLDALGVEEPQAAADIYGPE